MDTPDPRLWEGNKRNAASPLLRGVNHHTTPPQKGDAESKNAGMDTSRNLRTQQPLDAAAIRIQHPQNRATQTPETRIPGTCRTTRPQDAATSGYRDFGRQVHMHATPLKPDNTVVQSEKRVVPATTNMPTRKKRRSALANDDRARNDLLTAIALDAAELGIAVATVATGTLTLLMCHR